MKISSEVGFIANQDELDRALTRSMLAGQLFARSATPIRLGRFEILTRLGHGKLGAVYEALDTRHGGRVALKVLSRCRTRALDELEHEFASLSAVVHPNLAVLHALFTDPRSLYFSMERVDGVSFDRWARDVAPEPELRRLRAALRQLGAAVSALHDAGKLHGHLKPRNALVTPEGRLVVLDFGRVFDVDRRFQPCARLNDEISGRAYMAPEQADGGQVLAASDWYACGVMLFEALTGQRPSSGSLRDAPDPRECRADLPSDLCELCAALLRPDPGARAGRAQIAAVSYG